jgi:hypothetical protein
MYRTSRKFDRLVQQAAQRARIPIARVYIIDIVNVNSLKGRRKAREAEWKAAFSPPEAHDWNVPLDSTFQHPTSFHFLSQPTQNSVLQPQLMQAGWETITQPPQMILPQLQLTEVTPINQNIIIRSCPGTATLNTELSSTSNATFSPLMQLLIPYTDHPQGHLHQPPSTLIFPLPVDHLLTLVHYNVLRATLTNMSLLSLLHLLPSQCNAVQTLQTPFPATPTHIPPTLNPTALQLSTPHQFGIDSKNLSIFNHRSRHIFQC